ncbi:MAG: VWA domain-containing protein [Fibrobacteria bacterium]|nr:VWA domain-containing protein [Fibrobacteria bacterium]
MISTKTILLILISVIVFSTKTLLADGLLRSTDLGYPFELLRHTVSKIKVDVYGTAAQTTVYQEFINDGNETTNATYSFPLPDGAYGTQMLYSYQDSIYKAILQPIPQSNVPGTGEGGFVAELNQYLGKNKVSFTVKNIPAGGVQKIVFRYTQSLDFLSNKVYYRYPLYGGNFQPSSLNYLSFHIKVMHPAQTNAQFEFGTMTEVKTSKSDNINSSEFFVEKSKYIPSSDFTFSYRIKPEQSTNFVLYSKMNGKEGYYISNLFPGNTESKLTSANRHWVLLLDASTSMKGFKFEQSVEALKTFLMQLNQDDKLSIALFNRNVEWIAKDAQASSSKIKEIIGALSAIESNQLTGQTQILPVLNDVLNQSFLKEADSRIIVMTDGFSQWWSGEIGNPNEHPVFMVGLGDAVNHKRMEYISHSNMGFATFVNTNESVSDKLLLLTKSLKSHWIMDASHPLTSDSTTTNFPKRNNPQIYNGTHYYTVGKYIPGDTTFFHNFTYPSLQAGDNNVELQTVELTGTNAEWLQQFWYMESLKNLEIQSDLNISQREDRDKIIKLSLESEVKSMFTSYQADYSSVPDEVIYITDPTDELSILRTEKITKHNLMGIKASYRNGKLKIVIPNAQNLVPEKVEIIDLKGRIIRVSLTNLAMVSSNEVNLFLSKEMQTRLKAGLYFLKIKFRGASITLSINI